MSRPGDYRLILPEGWFRVDLEPGAREPGIARLTDRQFKGIDNAPHLKRQARDELLKAARNAYGNGDIEMCVSLQTAAGFPLPASLIVTLTPPHENDAVRVSPKRLAESVSGNGGQVTLATLPAGPAVRVRRRAVPRPDNASGHRSPVANLDVHIPVPGSGAYLVLSFATPLDP